MPRVGGGWRTGDHCHSRDLLITEEGEWVEATVDVVTARAADVDVVLLFAEWSMPLVLKRVAHAAISASSTEAGNRRPFTQDHLQPARPVVRKVLAAFDGQEQVLTASETDMGPGQASDGRV